MKRYLFAGLAAASVAAACSTDGRKLASAGAGRDVHDANAPADSRAPPTPAPSDAAPPMDAMPGMEAEGAPSMPDPLYADPRCTSGTMRDPNESEGPEMMPGHACIQCHAAIIGTGDDAPNFAFAGTAFPSGHEPNDCVGSGSEGAKVTVTDARGMTFSATVNDFGNFFLEDQAMKFPIQAMIELDGRRRSMTTPQMSSDCNSCHTQEGDEGAPGRITLP